MDSALAGAGWKKRQDQITQKAKEKKMRKKILERHEGVLDVAALPYSVLEEDMEAINEAPNRTSICKGCGH